MRVDKCYCRECEAGPATPTPSRRNGIYPDGPARLRLAVLTTGQTIASGTPEFIAAVGRWL